MGDLSNKQVKMPTGKIVGTTTKVVLRNNVVDTKARVAYIVPRIYETLISNGKLVDTCYKYIGKMTLHSHCLGRWFSKGGDTGQVDYLGSHCQNKLRMRSRILSYLTFPPPSPE